MTNSKTTRKALLSSALALLMCVAMLIATTFAWFTDTASTSVNKIQAGTLKVGLEMKNADGNWVDAEGTTLNFKKASTASGTEVLWEPGCTYELPAIRVVNEGNLAFKYKLVVSGAIGDTKLLDAIDFTVTDSSNIEVALTDMTGIIIPADKVATAGTEEKVHYSDENGITIKGHMKEEAGNEYKGLSVSGIAVTVYAEQYTYEYDSYSKIYDDKAEGIETSSPFSNYVNVTADKATDAETILTDSKTEPTITATIPADSTTATKLTLIKKPTANPDSVKVEIGNSALTTDVKIINAETKEVISAEGGKYFTIGIQLGQVDLQSFYHKGVKLTKVNNEEGLTSTGLYWYDFNSGIVTFTTDNFSTFTAVFKFSGGDGSETYPYLIGTANDWKGINQETQSEDKHYKQIADITAPTYVAQFAGTYDGGGYKLTAGYKFTTMGYAALFYEACGHVSFKNMTVTMTDFPVNLLRFADWGTAYGADFENITFNGTAKSATANNFGLVVADALYTSGGGEEAVVYNFNNITNNVSIENTGAATGVFIGSGPCFNTKTTLNFTNCTNNGDITGTSLVGYLYGNPTYVNKGCMNNTEKNIISEINVVNCKNTGTLHATSEDGLAAFALGTKDVVELNNEWVTNGGGTYISGPGVLASANLAVNQSGTSFSVSGAPAGDYTYKLAFAVGSTYHTVDGEAWTDDDLAKLKKNEYKADTIVWNVANSTKYFCDLTVNGSATGGHNTIKALDKRTAEAQGFEVDDLTFANSYALVVKDNTTYLILDIGDHQYVNSNVNLLVYAYDSSNNLVGVKTVS